MPLKQTELTDGLSQKDEDEYISKVLDLFNMLLRHPGAIVKPNDELIEMADELVEGVLCH